MRLAPALLAPVLALGCGGDDGPGSGDDTEGSSDSSSGSMTAASMSMTGMSADGSTGGMSANASGDSDGSTGGSSSGGPVEVTLSGELTDFVLDMPIPDAQISVWQTPGFETTSDADGLWMTGPFTPDQNIVFLVEPSTDYWGAVVPTAVGDMDDDDVLLSQISQEFVQMQFDQLMAQDPVPAEFDQAVIITRLVSPTALMEGDVTVTMTPAPPAGTFYAPDVSGAPVLDSNLMQFTLLPVVVYYNVPDTEPGDIAFEFDHPTRECTTVFTDYPTFAGFITLVDVTCPPA